MVLAHAPFPERVCFNKFNHFNLRPITMYNRIPKKNLLRKKI